MNRNTISTFLVALFVIILIFTGIGVSQTAGQDVSDANSSIIDLNNEQVNIQLQAQQREVEYGEPVVLVLSATSYVTNTEPLTVQLIVESSTGVSITESTAEQGSGSQFSTVTTVDPGSSESLRVIVNPNEAGTYQITTEIVYYVGEDQTSGSGERTSLSVIQKPEPRGLLWWSPTIIGFISGGSVALWLLQPPTGNRVKNWGSELPFWSTMALVGVGGLSIFISGLWFGSSARSIELPPVEIGGGLAVFAIFIGTVLTVVARVGRFTEKVRLGVAFMSISCVLAIPVQIIIILISSLY